MMSNADPDLDPAPDFGPEAARAALEWLIELGVDAAVGDVPIDAYALPDHLAVPKPAAAAASARVSASVPRRETPDPAAIAGTMAARAATLEDLRDAIAGFDQCDLRKGARNTVFADGNPKARVMIIGDAPDREEDLQGRPFVGRAGALFNAMFAAIGLSREDPAPERALYATSVIPWRPTGIGGPTPAEIEMLTPFLERHVALADPDIIVLMGNSACAAALGTSGITRLRGTWAEAFGRPALPIMPPAHLLRHPQAKREAWADLLSLSARLDRGPR